MLSPFALIGISCPRDRSGIERRLFRGSHGHAT